MRRFPYTVALLAALLVVVTVVGAGSALAATVENDPLQSVTVENDTVGRLAVPDTTTTGQRATADLSGALAGDQQRVQTALTAGAFRNAFESAPNESAKLAIVTDTLDRLETRATALREDRQAAIQSFARGDSTSDALFRKLARIQAAGEGIDERASVVETTVQESTAVSLSERATRRLAGIDGAVVTLDGPLTDRLTNSVRGAAAPEAISIECGESGAVFATIEGGTFVREATLWSERAESGANNFEDGETAPLSMAYQRAREAYPWAVGNLVSGLSVTGFGESPIYGVRLTHSHGDLETYLDGRTENVFYEVQRLQLSSLPTEAVATNTTDDLLIEVNATAVGPRAVTVRNATTGEEVIADITVGGATANRSRIGSRLWLLETGTERTITARRPDGTTVSITIGA
ncbi:DUF7094 domain-containing protein [Halorhabdus tiamatea]|nr:hypothetical protein [Halorhabdus tiamatea]